MPPLGLQVHPVEPICKAIALLAAYHDLVTLGLLLSISLAPFIF
jgi:hypothetical protein